MWFVLFLLHDMLMLRVVFILKTNFQLQHNEWNLGMEMAEFEGEDTVEWTVVIGYFNG